MPKIELALPGEQHTETQPVADLYRVTVERGDGIACTDLEAQTVMSMWALENAKGRVRKQTK